MTPEPSANWTSTSNKATLSQTEAQIPAFEIQLRQSPGPALHLVGHSAHRPASPAWDSGRFPRRRREVVVGIPAQLLERRPDIRSAERTAAAQAQQIGIAQADLYPHISITGTLGYSAQNASQLFTYPAFNGSVGPSFQWNILNYGRLANNVRLQDAKFQQTLLDYRTAVLTANQEAEDGLIAFLRSQEQTKMLTESVVAADKAFQIVVSQYRVGTVDFNRLATIETNLVTAAGSPGPGPRLRLPWAWSRSIGPWAAAGRSVLARERYPRLPQPTPAPAGGETCRCRCPTWTRTPGRAMPPQAPLPPPRQEK